MKSARHGTPTSGVEIRELVDSGFWLKLDAEELFVPFSEFPWFKGVPLEKLAKIERPQDRHLHWPDLDIDLAVESIRHPERFPLISRRGA